MPPAAAAVMAVGKAVAPFAMPVAAGAMVYSAVSQSQATKKAQSEAKKVRAQQEQQFQRELEAGEYFGELTKKQMELQAQSSNIKTLANLIEQQSQPAQQQLITLPPAKEYSAVDQINQALEKLFRG